MCSHVAQLTCFDAAANVTLMLLLGTTCSAYTNTHMSFQLMEELPFI